MIFIEITNVDLINYVFSIFVNITAIMATLFGALALTRH